MAIHNMVEARSVNVKNTLSHAQGSNESIFIKTKTRQKRQKERKRKEKRKNQKIKDDVIEIQ